MSVSVQLPGYNHTAPITGLADIINTIGKVRQLSQQTDLENSQTENEKLKNQGLQADADYKKKLSDASTPESAQARERLVANATLQKAFGRKAGLSDQDLSPLDQVIDVAKNGVISGMQAPPPGQEGPASPLRQAISGIDAQRMYDQSQFKELGDIWGKKMAAEATGNKLAGLVDTKNNSLANTITEEFAKHPSISKLQKQRDQIDVDRHTIDSGAPLTPQMYSELEKGFANALSGGGNSSVTSQTKIEFDNWKKQWASLIGKVSSDPQFVNTPEYRQLLSDGFNRLDNSYQRIQYANAQRLGQAKKGIFKNNPQAAQAVDQSVDVYKPQGTTQSPSDGTQQMPTQEEAIAEARKRGLTK